MCPPRVHRGRHNVQTTTYCFEHLICLLSCFCAGAVRAVWMFAVTLVGVVTWYCVWTCGQMFLPGISVYTHTHMYSRRTDLLFPTFHLTYACAGIHTAKSRAQTHAPATTDAHHRHPRPRTTTHARTTFKHTQARLDTLANPRNSTSPPAHHSHPRTNITPRSTSRHRRSPPPPTPAHDHTRPHNVQTHSSTTRKPSQPHLTTCTLHMFTPTPGTTRSPAQLPASQGNSDCDAAWRVPASVYECA
jgi:hypothetical protein